MILDPRLVPWSDVAPGMGVAAVVSLAGWFVARRGFWIGNLLLLLAPLAGWTLMIRLLEGHLPSFRPVDAPEWAWYFALAGALWGAASNLIRRPLVRAVVGFAVALLVMLCLIPALFLPVALNGSFFMPTAAWAALILLFLLILFSGSHPLIPRYPAAEMTPALAGLGGIAALLVLTGTATVGMAALGLCLATLPAAIGLLLLVGPASVDDRRSIHTAPPLFALGVFACAGPLYASTTWVDVCVVLSGCVAASGVIAGLRWHLGRKTVAAGMAQTAFRSEVVLIAVAFFLSVIPGVVVVFRLLADAEDSGLYY